MEGLATVAMNRKFKRGGGAMVVGDTEQLNLSKIDVMVPHNLEIAWSIAKPKSGILQSI